IVTWTLGLVTANDSPVNADWSILRGFPSNRCASAGIMSPRAGPAIRCSASCVVFLNETNGGVYDQQCGDTNEILSIWWLSLQIGA
ncbi:hypothetical protein Tco_0834920, partial [Tanacetum coccineum]